MGLPWENWKICQQQIVMSHRNRAELIPRLLVLVSWDCQEVSHLHCRVCWYLNGSYLLNILLLERKSKEESRIRHDFSSLVACFHSQSYRTEQNKWPPKGVSVLSLKALLGYGSDGPRSNMHFTEYHRSDTFPKLGKEMFPFVKRLH